MMKYYFVLLSSLFFTAICFSQNTIGTISYKSDEAYDGYNLIYPHNQSTVYIIDNCGDIIHSWNDDEDFRPGNTAYLLENGNLIKTKRFNASNMDPIWAGGGGHFVEIRDWDNNLLASFERNSDSERLHHDIAVTDIGNILMIAWELKTVEEAIQAGRDPNLLPGDQLWPEKIIEWNPVTDEIVWEWHVWDHLIQNIDPSKDNFGDPSQHPELVDINYDEHDGHQDWLHINSIDYNPVLDQIVLSVPYFNELWIIDHSTSTEEAASHEGGISGRGGDLLYRWGNPQAYGQGTQDDKKLFFQHDVKWVEGNATPNDGYFGMLSCFNNRVSDRYSSVHYIQTEFAMNTMTYSFSDSKYLPLSFKRTIVHPDTLDITLSSGLSSALHLPNQNVLVLSGRWGYAYEVNLTGEVVWEYRVPLRGGSPIEQGSELSVNNNITFKMDRYSLDYPGFDGKDLTPKGRLELNPNSIVCDVISSTKEIEGDQPVLSLIANPVEEILLFTSSQSAVEVDIFNLEGRLVKTHRSTKGLNQLSVETLEQGAYFLRYDYRKAVKFIKL